MRRPQHLKAALQILSHVHHSSRVVELSAVIRSAEDRHQAPVRLELVPVLYYLVSAADEVEVVSLEELVDDVVPEGVGDAASVSALGKGEGKRREEGEIERRRGLGLEYTHTKMRENAGKKGEGRGETHPARNTRVGISPKEVAKKTFVRDIRRPRDFQNLGARRKRK